MDNNTKNESKRTAEFQLKIISVFFAAFGAFVSGLFCIVQYFWSTEDYFAFIVAGFFFMTLLATYVLSYSKNTARSKSFLEYIEECANRVGTLSPLVMAVSFILAFKPEIWVLAICIVLEAMHLIAYFFATKTFLMKRKFGVLQKILRGCKRNLSLIITLLFALLAGIGWLLTADTLKISDLCLNLLAGFISSGITIGVIDRIIRKQKESKDIPLQKALYRDVQLFAARLIGLWQEIYVQSTETRTEITIEDLFDPENIITISSNLDLNGYPNVSPKQNWFAYIENQRKDLVERGEKILETYMSFAEPEIIQAIHFLINDSSYIAHLSFVNMVHTTDRLNKIPRPSLLAWHYMPPREPDYVMVKQLTSWCRRKFDVLHSKEYKDKIDIYPIAERITIINPNSAPTSIMSEDDKIKAFTRFKEWQDTSNKDNGAVASEE